MGALRLIDPREATSFEEYWPWYLSQHLEPGTQRLHVAGTLAASAVGISGIARRRLRLLLMAPLIGYAFALVGHFLIERNRPASGYPWWSFLADWRLVARTLDGTIDADVSAVRAALAAQATAATDAPSSPSVAA